MSDSTADKLNQILKMYGGSVLFEPKRCENMLRDMFGSNKRELNLLIGALEEEIPQTIANSSPENINLIGILTQKLVDQRGYSPEASKWAVETWSFAVDMSDKSEKVSGCSSISLCSEVSIDTVRIASGIFKMGNTDPGFDDMYHSLEMPAHDLFLPDYSISTAPITIRQFSLFVEETGYTTYAEKQGAGSICVGDREQVELSGVSWRRPGGPGQNTYGKENHPVSVVSWHDALAFCDWLSERSGKQIALPSEAEWEKAARGVDGRLYPWGNQLPNMKLCNYDFQYGDTTPVGTFHLSGDSIYGCMDMAGNVWEWTRSISAGYPYQVGDGREDLHDISARRQIRGGSFGYDYRYLRCCARHICGPYYSRNDLGFRIVVLEKL